MKKYLATILLCITVINAKAQCHLNSKKDNFDGSVTYWTRQVKIASDGVGLLAGQFDCKFKIFAHFVYSKSKIVLVLTEKEELCGCAPASITFKFANDSVLTKANLRQGQSKSTGVSEYERYSFFDLTKDELSLLASQGAVRFLVREMYCSDHSIIDQELARKAAGQIMANAACLKETLQTQ